jgi:hypothetical protein
MLRIYEPNFDDIPDEARSLYVSDRNGGWILDTNLDEIVTGLKSALRAEREARKAAEIRLRRAVATDGAEALRAFKDYPACPLLGDGSFREPRTRTRHLQRPEPIKWGALKPNLSKL